MTTTAYSAGLCYLSACTDDTDEEATKAVNLSNPTGVTPWAIADEDFASGDKNGRPCEDEPGKRHLLFSC
jgi:hypothetical protein